MPLYEYKCQECGLRYERIEHVSAMHDGTCPQCGGNAHRLIGAPALQFKGSGWYVNDYGKGNGSSPTAKETETAKSAAETSTDSKPEKKPEKKAEKKADAKVA
jgi:putative FmdB family regulatory protein